MSSVTIIFAQEYTECTFNSTEMDLTGSYPHITNPNYFNSLDPIVFNVFFWGINEDDGSSNNKLTENDALHGIAKLNKKYNQFNIYFKYFGYSYINSSQYHTIEDCSETGPPPYTTSCLYGSFPYFIHNNPQYENNNAINVYIPKSTIGFAGYGSWNTLRVVINSESFENEDSNLLNHEMGHVLRLNHTHLGWKNDPNPPLIDCEHVTRNTSLECDPLNPLEPCYNANIRGDQVHDTNAVPDFRNERCIELGYTEDNCPDEDDPNPVPRYYYISDSPDCEYDNPIGMDCQDTPYQITTEDVSNLMAYTRGLCSNILTLDQGVRMREKIDENPTKYNPVKNVLGIESLYQPYKGVYSTSGNTPSFPGLEPPTFQPGFTYVFKTCGPFGDYPPPPDYGDTSFFVIGNGATYTFSKDIPRENYDDIIHYNHYAIVIQEIEDTQAARCCYSVVGSGFDDGAIVKFNDGVFNSNVTITPQDSTQINDPNLINQLEPGLYNIQQNYNGSTQETTIIKENN